MIETDVHGEEKKTLPERDVLFYLDSLNHYLNERSLRIVSLQEQHENDATPQIVLGLNWF
jgi:hypothetical protein